MKMIWLQERIRKIRSLHEKIKDENIGIEVIAIVNDKYASI